MTEPMYPSNGGYPGQFPPPDQQWGAQPGQPFPQGAPAQPPYQQGDPAFMPYPQGMPPQGQLPQDLGTEPPFAQQPGMNPDAFMQDSYGQNPYFSTQQPVQQPPFDAQGMPAIDPFAAGAPNMAGAPGMTDAFAQGMPGMAGTPDMTNPFAQGPSGMDPSGQPPYGMADPFAQTMPDASNLFAQPIADMDQFAQPAPGAGDSFMQGASGMADPFAQTMPDPSNPFGQAMPGMADPFAQGALGIADPFAQPAPDMANPFAQATTEASNPFAQPAPDMGQFMQPAPEMADPFAQAASIAPNPFEPSAQNLQNPIQQSSAATTGPLTQASPGIDAQLTQPMQPIVDPMISAAPTVIETPVQSVQAMPAQSPSPQPQTISPSFTAQFEPVAQAFGASSGTVPIGINSLGNTTLGDTMQFSPVQATSSVAQAPESTASSQARIIEPATSASNATSAGRQASASDLPTPEELMQQLFGQPYSPFDTFQHEPEIPVTPQVEASKAVVQPEVAQPVEVQTAAVQPVAVQPEVAQPVEVQPAAVQPVAAQPEAAQPQPSQAAVQATAAQPVTAQPAVVQPAAAQPEVAQAAAAQPVAQSQTMQPIEAQNAGQIPMQAAGFQQEASLKSVQQMQSMPATPLPEEAIRQFSQAAIEGSQVPDQGIAPETQNTAQSSKQPGANDIQASVGEPLAGMSISSANNATPNEPTESMANMAADAGVMAAGAVAARTAAGIAGAVSDAASGAVTSAGASAGIVAGSSAAATEKPRKKRRRRSNTDKTQAGASPRTERAPRPEGEADGAKDAASRKRRKKRTDRPAAANSETGTTGTQPSTATLQAVLPEISPADGIDIAFDKTAEVLTTSGNEELSEKSARSSSSGSVQKSTKRRRRRPKRSANEAQNDGTATEPELLPTIENAATTDASIENQYAAHAAVPAEADASMQAAAPMTEAQQSIEPDTAKKSKKQKKAPRKSKKAASSSLGVIDDTENAVLTEPAGKPRKSSPGTSTATLILGIFGIVFSFSALALAIVPIFVRISALFGEVIAPIIGGLGLLFSAGALIAALIKKSGGKVMSTIGILFAIGALVISGLAILGIVDFYGTAASKQADAATTQTLGGSTITKNSSASSSVGASSGRTNSSTGTTMSSAAAPTLTDLPIGASAEYESGLTVTVNSISDQAPKSYDNKPIVCVNVTYVNDSNEPVTFNPVNWAGEDSNGAQRASTIYVDGTDELSAGTLVEGGTVSGNIYFEGPVTKILYKPKYTSSANSASWNVS